MRTAAPHAPAATNPPAPRPKGTPMPSPHSADIAQALAIIRDPRPDLGMTTKGHACKIRSVLRSLLMELQWLQLRDAADRDKATDVEETLRVCLARVLAIHVPVPGTDDRPRCGSCAELWPCRTSRAITGEKR